MVCFIARFVLPCHDLYHPSAPSCPGSPSPARRLIDLIRRPDGSYLPCLGGALLTCAAHWPARGGHAVPQPLVLRPLWPRTGGAVGGRWRGLAQPEPVQQVTLPGRRQPRRPRPPPDHRFLPRRRGRPAVSAQGLGAACAALPACSWFVPAPGTRCPRRRHLPALAGCPARAGHCVVVDANLRPSVMPDLAAYRSAAHAAPGPRPCPSKPATKTWNTWPSPAPCAERPAICWPPIPRPICWP